MSKLHFKDNRCEISYSEPDDKERADIGGRIAEAIRKEIANFCDEIGVEMRRLKPGGKKTLKFTPMVVSISREKENAKVSVTA